MQLKILIALIMLGLSVPLTAQIKLAPNTYWFAFTDKQGSPYQMDRPEEFLTQRALQRRKNQGIDINITDLPTSPVYLDSLQAMGCKLIHASKWLNGVAVHIAEADLMTRVLALDFVQELSPRQKTNAKSWQQGSYGKVPPFYRRKGVAAFLHSSGYKATGHISMLNAQFLHSMGFRGQGVQIAVTDDGFLGVDTMPAFAHLWQNGQILGGYDFVDCHDDPFGGGTHGLQVFSIMACQEPDELVGTAPEASFWLFRTEKGANEYELEEINWVAAAEKADSLGVDVINVSLGYGLMFSDSNMDYSYNDMDGKTTFIAQGASVAVSTGMLVVTSAGNEGNDPWHYITSPADVDGVLAVGAVTSTREASGFTSFGPTADGRIKPSIAALGVGVQVMLPNGRVSAGSGTSFSSPIIAGLVACLWQALPQASAQQLIGALEKSANNYQKPTDDLGYGLPDFEQAYTEFLMGQGASDDFDDLFVYPNPIAHDFVLVLQNATVGQDYQLHVINDKGLTVYRQTFEAQISNPHFYVDGLQQLSNGLYFIGVLSGNTFKMVKVIKQIND